MTKTPCLLVPLLLLACGASDPGGDADASVDYGASEILPAYWDMNGAQLCTSAACAAAPCTGGCVFAAKVGSCDAATPSPVSTATVLACGGFCGKFDRNRFQGGTGCSRYNGNRPGCEVCGFRWGQSSCYDTSPDADYLHGGAICSGSYICFDGRPVADLDPGCSNKDMFPSKDYITFD